MEITLMKKKKKQEYTLWFQHGLCQTALEKEF